MKNNVLYKQCELNNEIGEIWIAWVPIALAKIGKNINIKKIGMAVIRKVFDNIIVDHEEILEMENYWKHQREASDI